MRMRERENNSTESFEKLHSFYTLCRAGWEEK